ncbi:hypothetical protein F5X68DRAFT_210278 [Plectosphaerella plurivora]|uniref:Secreted protein n=1 Tax=Plectosphaerella plurivora TaxID=936078 RepID=A0A9P8V9E3_9PEZI|nr:hypothetical protein F5X68DRAFT_210278 [Plectosphaerella plurivora]
MLRSGNSARCLVQLSCLLGSCSGRALGRLASDSTQPRQWRCLAAVCVFETRLDPSAIVGAEWRWEGLSWRTA